MTTKRAEDIAARLERQVTVFSGQVEMERANALQTAQSLIKQRANFDQVEILNESLKQDLSQAVERHRHDYETNSSLKRQLDELQIALEHAKKRAVIPEPVQGDAILVKPAREMLLQAEVAKLKQDFSVLEAALLTSNSKNQKLESENREISSNLIVAMQTIDQSQREARRLHGLLQADDLNKVDVSEISRLNVELQKVETDRSQLLAKLAAANQSLVDVQVEMEGVRSNAEAARGDAVLARDRLATEQAQYKAAQELLEDRVKQAELRFTTLMDQVLFFAIENQ